ncbi:MAG: hypothetical protein Sv326_1193 [Candidatus Fermentimicrarchaeum limneticum]|uniref:Prepilin type IV endopeptidase peptidase domain-containing protein n=1 Tax=Fermentimicrarchaeum limneticum TaxID=2795018 RepID=A0A7D5XMH5_FERL1|nr:MAG: hypothetical protein Sv326_1193 [Candidatus Fermentimicrarchaeum limneticum]
MLDNPVFILNTLFVLVLGIVTSYGDIRKNKISNRYVIIAVILAFLTNVLGSYFAQASTDTKMLYIQTTLLNAFFALLVGFILWYAKIWRAGDGKLFFAYAFLLPVSTYYYGYVAYFPSFTLLVNTLIPLFLILTFNLWYITSTEEKFEIFKSVVNPKRLFYMLLSLMSTQWIISILFQRLLSVSDFLTAGCISILVLVFLTNHLQDILYEISIPVVILRIMLDYGTVVSYSFFTQFLLLFGLFLLAITFITNLASFRFNDKIRVPDVKKGMCCVERISRKGRFYEKTLTPHNRILKLNYESLTQDDVDRLKRMNKNGQLRFDELTIQQTIPFAPLLFFGVLLTIVLRGDVLTHLKLLFNSVL